MSILPQSAAVVTPPFRATLERHGLELRRAAAVTLQINVGRLCDLACHHCHLEAGPQRQEVMTRATMDTILAVAERHPFAVADITGGAPELVADLPYLIDGLAARVPRLLLRSNLTALDGAASSELLTLCRERRVVLVASFPALAIGQTDAQRGGGTWERSLAMLRRLNALGYGIAGSGLELNLVANPAGAFLPAAQTAQEKRFKQELSQRHGIVFNHLYTFANAPLGRFRRWLDASGNLDSYLARLADNFNPGTVAGLMCRTLVSVDWDGTLYDCDFNLAANLPLGERRHIGDPDALPAPGAPVAVGDHCYACTAGSGFT